MVLLVLGFFVVKGDQGAVMVGVGVALAALAGLELSIREHFAGYRSHTLLLAGFVGGGRARRSLLPGVRRPAGRRRGW